MTVKLPFSTLSLLMGGLAVGLGCAAMEAVCMYFGLPRFYAYPMVVVLGAGFGLWVMVQGMKKED